MNNSPQKTFGFGVLYDVDRALASVLPAESIDMLDVKVQGNAVLLPVKVVPGSSRDRFAGVLDGRAKICVAAPPEKGKANKAVTRLLARLLGVHHRAVVVESGHTSSGKTIRIEGITVAQLYRALGLDPPAGETKPASDASSTGGC